MKTETFHLELITPCFCGGAEPEKQAEIRAPSIRGQLRWWFRTLGGFKSLAPMPVPEQEAMIFGSTAGDKGKAGKLMLRVLPPKSQSTPANADDLHAGMNTPLGYALFPLRPMAERDGRRGKISEKALFQLTVLWRGPDSLWNPVRALAALWAHLGGLGFRSRRTFGALRLVKPNLHLPAVLEPFSAASAISIKELEAFGLEDWRKTSAELLKWYRSWRQHGQMWRRWDKERKKWITIPNDQKDQNRAQPGFRYARRDHNEGLDVQGAGAPDPDAEGPAGQKGATFRPALGLPIIQFFSSLGGSDGQPIRRSQATVHWDWDWDVAEEKAVGRFASPVLLRPHRDAQGNWHALVIFVDAHKWPKGKQVFLNGQPRAVSLDLYEAMKGDPNLKPFLVPGAASAA